MNDRYITLQGTSEGLYREKASKFIAWAFPLQDEHTFKEICAGIAKEHHAARHACWAWVLGEDGARTRSNDDSEPSGTAGRPILRAIQSAGLTQVGVVVVRYFGGTLLGKAGLVHAYGTAAQEAIAAGVRLERVLHTELLVTCGYDRMELVKRDALQHEGHIVRADLTDHCVLLVAVARSAAEPLLERWRKEGLQAHYAERK